jgi:4-amino-4-deoxy-L-arabinose transferase-like glycosyltransferase
VDGGLKSRITAWVTGHPVLTLVVAVCVCLGPFLAKPFNMDDPLFIWSARQIHSHPLNPFGFDVNWYGVPLPIANEMENPPLASYYIALVAAVFGWSEIALHGAFLLASVAVVVGTWRLARRFCQRPLLAASVVLFSPVFLVSSTTVMCDVLMLAFWIWAVDFWMDGIDGDPAWPLAVSAVLMTLAGLTKYFGIALLPLLAFYTLLRRRRVLISIVCLLIPSLLICGWLAAAQKLYKHNPISQAAFLPGRLQQG